MSNLLMDKMIEYITSANYEDLPDDIKEMSKFAIIDTVGVSLAGWNEPAVEILREAYASKRTGDETAFLWGDSKKVALEYAGLINGTATHALDFDDVTPTVLAHPSAPITASIIPVSENLGKSGKELITAYAIGTEVMIRVGQVMGFNHYDLGWHATSTLGTIGATVACGYLMGLDREKLTNAIAISASMAGGLQKNFGTMTKPLHVGLSAQHAIQSSLLARRGFTGNSEVFESRGFFNAFGGNKEWGEFQEKYKEVEFGKPYDYQVNGLSVKKFPCCYATHRFTQGVLELKEEFDLNLENVEVINVLVPSGGLLPLIHNRPTTGLQGKFSAEYTCLAALADGSIQLQTFTDDYVQRPEIQEMLANVKVKEMEGMTTEGQQLDETPVQVAIELHNGDKYEKVIYHAPGSKGSPMSIPEYQLKWLNCLKYFSSSPDNGDDQINEKINDLFQQGANMESITKIEDWISDITGLVNTGMQIKM